MVFIKSSISFHQIKPSLSSHSSLRPDCWILSCHLINSNSGGAQARRGLGTAQLTSSPLDHSPVERRPTQLLVNLRSETTQESEPLWRTKTQYDLKTVPERKKKGNGKDWMTVKLWRNSTIQTQSKWFGFRQPKFYGFSFARKCCIVKKSSCFPNCISASIYNILPPLQTSLCSFPRLPQLHPH